MENLMSAKKLCVFDHNLADHGKPVFRRILCNERNLNELLLKAKDIRYQKTCNFFKIKRV